MDKERKMKAKVNDKIRIVNKQNDWSMEYRDGDVFTVESTWYGGVNVTSRSGVPLSLDEVEYEVFSEDGTKASLEVRRIVFHGNTEGGFFRAVREIKAFLEYSQAQGRPVKAELLLQGEAVSLCADRDRTEEALWELTGLGVGVYLCGASIKELGISEKELAGGLRVCPLGTAFLAERQEEGFVYIKF